MHDAMKTRKEVEV